MGLTKLLSRRGRKESDERKETEPKEGEREKRYSLIEFIKRGHSVDLPLALGRTSTAPESLHSFPLSSTDENAASSRAANTSAKCAAMLNSFQSWLTSLAPPVTLAPASTSQPAAVDLARESVASEKSIASVQLPLSIDLKSIDSKPLRLSAEIRSLNTAIAADAEPEPEPETPDLLTINVKVKDLRLANSSSTDSCEVNLSRNASFADLNKELAEKGFEPLLGLWSYDRQKALKPSASIKDPIPVVVTEGESSYDMESGLQINKDETFQSFLAKLQFSIRVVGSKLSVNGGSLKVGFHRTLRIPHDGQLHGLPPDCGLAPVFNAAPFTQHLSSSGTQESEDMSSKGGIIVPLYQREAMWIEFEAERPFTIRMFMSGFNCITGLPAKAPKNTKRPDFIIAPQQSRIQGAASSNGKLRQLIAMPLAADYSLEKKLPGRPDVLRLQLEITPSGSELGFYAQTDGYQLQYSPSHTAQQFGVEAGCDLYLRSVRPSGEMPIMGEFKGEERSALLRELYIGEPEVFKSKASLELRALYRIKLTIERTDVVSKPVVTEFSPFTTVAQVASEVHLNHSPLSEFVLIYNNEVLEQDEKTLAELGFTPDVHLYARKDYAAANRPPPERSDSDLSTIDEDSSEPEPLSQNGSNSSLPPPKTAMPLTRTKSRSFPDQIWCKSITSLVSIQIPNSAAFEDITGMLMPPSPVTPQSYANAGLPFYTLYEEKPMTAGRALNSKNVRTLVQVHDLTAPLKLGSPVLNEDSVACTVCQRNMSDCILRPCDHVFCSSCVAKRMTNHVIVTCAVCHENASKVLGLSAPVRQSGEGAQVQRDKVITIGAWEADHGGLSSVPAMSNTPQA